MYKFYKQKQVFSILYYKINVILPLTGKNYRNSINVITKVDLTYEISKFGRCYDRGWSNKFRSMGDFTDTYQLAGQFTHNDE